MKNLFKKTLALCFLALTLTTTACADTPAGQNDETGDLSSSSSKDPDISEQERFEFSVSSLKGPTTMGLVKLLKDSENNETGGINYTADIYGTTDEIVTGLVKGDIQAANVPCNLASVLYGKTDGNIRVVAINTMGVLYMVENGDTISAIEDLRGKKIYTTGKGTTPEFILKYILQQNGIDPDNDVEIEFKSESAEVAALLSNPETSEGAVALLPQPYITIAGNANPDLRIALNMQDEWVKVNETSNIVTGVTVVRKEFLEENPDEVKEFLNRYNDSVNYVNANTDEAAALVAGYDIAPEPVAKKALPLCSISFVTGEEMKKNIEGYLQVLYDFNPQAVGGALPDEAFYYLGE